MKKQIFASLLSLVLMLQVFCFTALAAEPMITYNVNENTVSVSADGFEASEEVSLVAFINAVDFDAVDYLDQYTADADGVVAFTYPSRIDWNHKDKIIILLNGAQYEETISFEPVVNISFNSAAQKLIISGINFEASSEIAIEASVGDKVQFSTVVNALEDYSFTYEKNAMSNWKVGDVLTVLVNGVEYSFTLPGSSDGDPGLAVYAETAKITFNASAANGLYSVKAGSTGALGATGTPTPTGANAQPVWTSSNESVVKIVGADRYVAVKAGVSVITATYPAHPDGTPAKASFTMRVNP